MKSILVSVKSRNVLVHTEFSLKECTKKPVTDAVSGKIISSLRSQVLGTLSTTLEGSYRVYSLLMREREREMPTFQPRTTATRLFLAEDPDGRLGSKLFSFPEQ